MTAPLPWEHPDWLPAARRWIAAQADALGLRLAGAIEQRHVRPWSTVLQVPTAQGMVYFKAVNAALRHEPAVTAFLAGLQPDLLPPVLAVETGEGWLLLGDAGTTLRALVRSPADLAHWERLLPRYAELQQAAALRLPDLLATGILDRRLEQLPALYAGLLDDHAALLLGQAGGLTPAAHNDLRGLAGRVAALCAELAAYGLPAAVQHDDFHDANIFYNSGGYAIADWGESCAAHPFFSLLIAARSTAYRLGLAEDGPEMLRLRAAYLEAWEAFAPRADLWAAFAVAQRLARVNRALTWRHVLAPLTPAQRAEDADAVSGWLQDFLATETAQL